MPRIQLRISDEDPYLYLQPTSDGSVAIGTDDLDSNKLKIVMSDVQSNLDPASGTPSISIDPSFNGNIEIQPKGITGSTIFVNGDVSITGDSGGGPGTGLGNLNLENTIPGGDVGAINYGGSRFIHNFGTANTFVGSNAGNTNLALTGGSNVGAGVSALTSLESGSANIGVGSTALGALTTGTENVAIGTSSLSVLTTTGSNTAVGQSTLSGLLTGSRNTALGYDTATNFTGSESNNITIRNVGTTGDNNTIRIGTQGSGSGQQNATFIAGINGTSVTPAGNVVISSSGQLGTSSAFPITWSQVTGTTQSAAANAGYIANNAGTVTITLISAASAGIGTMLRVTGMNNATGWVIAQNASQQIFFGVASTTAGVTGSLASTATRDSVELVCISADGLFWNVLSSVGNITVT